MTHFAKCTVIQDGCCTYLFQSGGDYINWCVTVQDPMKIQNIGGTSLNECIQLPLNIPTIM